MMSIEEIRALVRTVPDFPKPGIMFRDVTTLFAHGEGLRSTIAHLAEVARPFQPDCIAGIEARGFIVGAALATALGIGFVPVRKPGKLPAETIGVDYALEYGTDRLELHKDALSPGERVLICDDLIATGGTALAARELILSAGAEAVGALFIVDLPDLLGASLLEQQGVPVHALMRFSGH